MEQLTYQRQANNFDFIRFLAASFVIITHSFDLSGHYDTELLYRWSEGYIAFSYLGVRAFFLISGFLITQSMLGSSSYISYGIKRVMRIFPGLAVALLLTVFVYGACRTTLPLGDYFSNSETYTYFKNVVLYRSQAGLPGVLGSERGGFLNGSLWTLVYEVTFYVLIAVAHALDILRRPVWIVVTVGGLVALDAWMRVRPLLYESFYPSVGMKMGAFLEFSTFFGVGSLHYLYRQRIPYSRVGFVVVLIGWLVVIKWAENQLFHALTYFLFSYLLFCLTFWPSRLKSFGQPGDYSYGIYIYAYPIQLLIIALMPAASPWLMAGISWLLTFPFAWVSWWCVEEPLLRLKKHH